MVDFLFLFTIVNKLALCVLFLCLPKDKKHNALFALLIFCPLPMILCNYFIHVKGIVVYPLSIINHLFIEPYLVLPIIYVHKVLGEIKKYNWYTILINVIIVFIPFVIYVSQPLLGEATFTSFKQAILYDTDTNNTYNNTYTYIEVISVLYLAYLVYYTLSYKKRHPNLLKKKKYNLKYQYIKKVVFSHLVIVLLSVISSQVIGRVFTEKYTYQILLDLYIFFIIYQGLVKGVIQLGSIEVPTELEEISEEEISFGSQVSIFTNPELQDNWDVIEADLKDRRLYLDPKLTIEILADKTNIPKYKVSEVISEHPEFTNFNHLINSFRVEHFLANTDKPYSLEAIAKESGFSSKSTFNRVFKDLKGMTPSAFIKANTSQISQ